VRHIDQKHLRWSFVRSSREGLACSRAMTAVVDKLVPHKLGALAEPVEGLQVECREHVGLDPLVQAAPRRRR
jgi:hypothetical protein